MGQVGADKRIPGARRLVLKGTAERAAHDVDQGVESAPTLSGSGEQRIQSVGFAGVSDVHDGISAHGIERSGDAGDGRFIPVNEGHSHAVGREVERDCLAQPAGAAGHDRDGAS